jgi:DNA-directed RNA polymerase specialized sigma24 family protein
MAEDARPDLPQPDPDPARQPEGQPELTLVPEAERERLEEAARRTRAKANRYAARHLGDGLQGEEILDDVLQSAIAAASRKRIEMPEGYLFRGVVRRVWKLLSHKPRVEYVGSSPDLDVLSGSRSRSSGHEVERNLLIKEIIALMDEDTREIHFRRARGDRWSSIAADLGISEAAAEERFRYGMEKVRVRVAGFGRGKEAGSAQGGNQPSRGRSQARRV